MYKYHLLVSIIKVPTTFNPLNIWSAIILVDTFGGFELIKILFGVLNSMVSSGFIFGMIFGVNWHWLVWWSFYQNNSFSFKGTVSSCIDNKIRVRYESCDHQKWRILILMRIFFKTRDFCQSSFVIQDESISHFQYNPEEFFCLHCMPHCSLDVHYFLYCFSSM